MVSINFISLMLLILNHTIVTRGHDGIYTDHFYQNWQKWTHNQFSGT